MSVLGKEDAVEAAAAYAAASEAALKSAQRLNDAWRRYLQSAAEEPSLEWVAEVAEQQRASELALERARMAMAFPAMAEQLVEEAFTSSAESSGVHTRRKRRHKNKFLAKLGRPGQRLLWAVLLVLLVISGLVAGGAGISLGLEIAGFLRLIDDPVQLPVGVQLAVFVVAGGMAIGLRRLMKPVERAIYGRKGVRPKAIPF